MQKTQKKQEKIIIKNKIKQKHTLFMYKTKFLEFCLWLSRKLSILLHIICI